MSLISSDLQRTWSRWKSAAWWPAVLLIVAQMASGMRDMPQFAFFLLYLQEQLSLTPVAISSVVAGAQLAGTVAALLGGAIAAKLGSKWVLVCGLMLAGLSSLVFQVDAFWLVVLLWLTSGAGTAMVTVGGSSYLTRLRIHGALGILSALYVLSMTIGGAIGNPIAALVIEQRGFGVFGWAVMALSAVTIVVIMLLMPHLQDQATEPAASRFFWASALPTARDAKMQRLLGLRCLPTIFYGMLTVLIPLLLNTLSGSKVTVAAYGTATLLVASVAQLLAGQAADRWGARRPTLVAYAAIVLSGLGLAVGAGSVGGLFVFGVLGIAAAWSLSTLMYVWVADGIPKAEHPATFGLLHAGWSLSMISGSLLGGWLVRATPGLPFLLAGLLNVGSLFLTFAYYNHTSVGNQERMGTAIHTSQHNPSTEI